MMDSVSIIENYFSFEKYKINIAKIDPINFEFEYVEAFRSAKMTDFFMFSPAMYGIDFFITTKAKSLLQKYKLPLHTYIPVTIFHKEIEYLYWALYIPSYYNENSFFIEKCIFNKGGLFNKEIITFKSLEEYVSRKTYFSAERIVYNNTVDLSLDLFLSKFVGARYIISESLKKAIQSEGLTGINIQEPYNPEIYFEQFI